MDKFFDIIKKLRPGVQSGKVSREQALAELMQESGVSEDIAGSAVTKMMPSSGGITTLPEAEVLDVSFKPGVDKRGKRVEESPSQASGAKEKTSWKDYVEEDTPSQGSGFANIDPDILSLGQKDRFEYEMAKYKQERSKRMQPFYKKYGAQSEKDKELVDELYEYNLEGEFVPSKGNPKYINNSARTFMQESVEDIPGVDEDLVLDILYLASGITAACFMVTILVLIVSGMIARWSGVALPGTTEFAGYAMAATSFFALSYAMTRGAHIRVSILLNANAFFSRWLDVFAVFGAAVIATYFARYAVKTNIFSKILNDRTQGQDQIPEWIITLISLPSISPRRWGDSIADTSSELVYTPVWVPQLAMSIGTIILAIALWDTLYRTLTTNKNPTRGEVTA